MKPLNCDGVVIDRCAACGGLWFDAGEMGRFRDGLEQMALNTIPRAPSVPSATGVAPTLACPRCLHGLKRGEYAYGTGVCVARCAECEGVWLPGTQVVRFITHLREARAKRGETMEIAESIAESANARISKHDAMNYSSLRYSRIFWFLNFIPVHADSADTDRPRATIAILALQLFAMIFLSSETTHSLALVPAELFTLTGLGTLLSSSFVHSGWSHFIGNAIFLVVFGRALEGSLGAIRFFAVYFFTDFASSLAFVFFDAGLASTAPCLGASGAISGVLGAYLLLQPTAKVTMLLGLHKMRIPAWVYLGAWFAMQITNAWWESMWGASGGVAWSAHIGGFIVGALLGWRCRREGY